MFGELEFAEHALSSNPREKLCAGKMGRACAAENNRSYDMAPSEIVIHSFYYPDGTVKEIGERPGSTS
jgi:hypothetical protein